MPKVYVGNLPDNCNRENLRGLFEPYGKITDVAVIKNFAFIHFTKDEDANNAVQDLHNSKMLGQQIVVQISNSKSRDDRNGGDRRRDNNRDRNRDSDRRDNRGPRRGGPPPPQPNPLGLGGILGAAPADQNNVLGNLGIFSAVNTLAVAAAAERQQLELQNQNQQRANNSVQPDPDVRVRREAVHTRDVPNAKKLGLSDGYVIYERYYVDPQHPLLKGLPIPELPRMTDSFVTSDPYKGNDRRDNYDDFRDRSPINPRRDDYDRERDSRSRDYTGY